MRAGDRVIRTGQRGERSRVVQADHQPVVPSAGEPFPLTQGVIDLSDDLRSLFRGTWRDLAAPGNAWDGADRIAIAAAARAVRLGQAADEALDRRAIAAIELTVARPWEATETRVAEMVATLGETGYVELVGVVGAVHGIDIATALLGEAAEPLPRAQAGLPVSEEAPGLRRRSAWVAMDGAAGPRRALAAAPRIRRTVNRLLDTMYPESVHSGREGVPETMRMQMETVVLAASLANRCSYCVLVHMQSLLAAAARQQVDIDLEAVADGRGDIGFRGGRELVALGRASSSAQPGTHATRAVAAALGDETALAAVQRAAAIQIANRLATMTGQRVPKSRRDGMLPHLETVGALAFPHADLVREPSSVRRKLAALKRGLRRGRSGAIIS